MNKTIIRDGEKYLWHLPGDPPQAVLDLARTYNLSVPIIHALYARGMTTKEALDTFLFSTYERDVTHPQGLRDAQKAVDRILQAIKSQEKILICGDYDVDGITSSALLLTCLVPLGAQINFFLPHRVHDGYGLSTKTVQRAANNNYQVLITVDNGISAFDAADEAAKQGIDLIITDHHRPHETLPQAYAIVNPHQDACTYPFKEFAGVGVIFKVMVLLYEHLKKPLPQKVFELMTLGTIADVVPLTGENRYWVRHGLAQVNNNESLAIQVLKENARFIKPTLTATDIGFSLTPQLNALGRLEDARDGVAFLIAQDTARVNRIGTVLKELNEARRAIERRIFADIDKQIAAGDIDLTQERVLVVTGTDWQPGVIGLVASRLVGAYNRPTILLAASKDGLAKGSCRSIPGFNIFEALAEHQDLLTSFGGHAQAAGLALAQTNVPELKKRLEETFARLMPDYTEKAALALDAHLTLDDVTKKLTADLAHLEPFGHANSQPLFYIPAVSLYEPPKLLKDAHTKCLIWHNGTTKPVIFFNRPDIYAALQEHGEAPFAVAVHASENHFNGRVSVELYGVDIAL